LNSRGKESINVAYGLWVTATILTTINKLQKEKPTFI
jgi:hypothetical protein